MNENKTFELSSYELFSSVTVNRFKKDRPSHPSTLEELSRYVTEPCLNAFEYHNTIENLQRKFGALYGFASLLGLNYQSTILKKNKLLPLQDHCGYNHFEYSYGWLIKCDK